MTWPDVEFLDPGGVPVVEGEPPPVHVSLAARFPIASLITLGGWILAGALAILASLRLAFSASLASVGGPTVRFSVDGWGRERAPSSTATFGEHGARLGIALCVVAGLMALLVALAAWRAWRGSARATPNRAITSLAVVAPCVLAAVTLTEWLVIDGVLSGYRAINRQNATVAAGSATGSGSPAIQTHIGPSIWLAVAALACAAAASAIYVWPRPNESAHGASADISAEAGYIPAVAESEMHLDEAEFLV
ncbi:MAG: hypothetical protein M3N95_06415 [Actinomycetota bacterium]|nr:hypothetical protein [Actinomycetota bacterium]